MHAVTILNVLLATAVVVGILSILGRATAVKSAALGALRLGIVGVTGLVVLTTASGALASSGGNANAGDVWTDNVGQPAGPGHEQDPHLACQDIQLWGSHMADASGSYAIDGWAPSGHQEQDYAGTWNYTAGSPDPQKIAKINVQTLIATAVANGDKPVNKQGYHFKLQLSQDPQKHKTFWVNCPAPSPPPTGGKQTPPPVVPITTPTGTQTGSSTGTPPPKTAVKATHRRRHRHKLVRPKRHDKPRRRTSGVRDAKPEFTG